tara:strand:- start:376 stop:648 length:273 start_codon:yes stop_codon:yes gene_type:complete
MEIRLTQVQKEATYKALNLKAIKKAVENGENPIMFLYKIEEGITFMNKYNSIAYNDYVQNEAQKVSNRLLKLHKKLMLTFWNENGELINL